MADGWGTTSVPVTAMGGTVELTQQAGIIAQSDAPAEQSALGARLEALEKRVAALEAAPKVDGAAELEEFRKKLDNAGIYRDAVE